MKNINEKMAELGIETTDAEKVLKAECLVNTRHILRVYGIDDHISEILVDKLIEAGRRIGADQAMRCGKELFDRREAEFIAANRPAAKAEDLN